MAHRYTPEQIKYLVSIVSGHSYKEIIEMFYDRFKVQLTVSQVNSFIGNRKLNTGRTGRFEKGCLPFNKGKKGTGGWEPTQFKRGHKAHNWVPIGTERINADGYVDIKIQDGKLQKNWKGKHILIWEGRNGPVPKGHVVIFGDGNNRNFDPSNLILVSRKQLAILNKNKLIQNDTDLTRTAVITADLILKIGERKHRKLDYGLKD